MTSASALTPQRARDLGRTLAHRLVPPPQDPAGLAESASQALLSLLPTWLPPGEQGTAAALRQLVHLDSFSAFLLAPDADAVGEPARLALQRQLGQTFAEPLQSLLLLFSDGCREALRGRPAMARLPLAATVPLAPTAAMAGLRAAGSGSLLGFAVAALACFGLGWLGYQLVARLNPAASPALPVEVQSSAPGSAQRGDPSVAIGSPSVRTTTSASRRLSAAPQPSLIASARCLSGGQSEIAAPADASNYGPRLAQDWRGQPVPHLPVLIVLHETVVDEATALNLFRRHHSEDGHQASYHVLIGRDGRRLRLVDDAQRAFGAGDSAFEGRAVQLKPDLQPSVNNIALHVSLVSPADGANGEARGHSGYTPEQYRSLASQIALWQARWRIPASRVVTHQEVDRSGSRRDPRSFDWAALGRDLSHRWIACGGSAQLADLGR